MRPMGYLKDDLLSGVANDKFSLNANGHFVLSFNGIDLSGAEEIERLTSAGYVVDERARGCLLNPAPQGFDASPKLVVGRTYKVALLPAQEIERDDDRTTDALLELGIGRYGYKKPLARFMPRLREVVSDEEMNAMGFYRINGLHDPVVHTVGVPCTLSVDPFGHPRYLSAVQECPWFRWYGFKAFAFEDHGDSAV